MRTKPTYCTNPTADNCRECSLVNYGYDCRNNKIIGEGSKTFSTKKEKREADALTKELTGFSWFQDLLDAEGGYRPSLNTSENIDALRLANLYDAAQKIRGDSRRASRY